MGEDMVDSRSGLTAPSTPGNVMRFFNAKKRSLSGGRCSIAKPTKSLGGLPFFQFIPSRAIPSPRCNLRVKSAAEFLPLT